MERKIGEIFEYDGEWYQCVNTGHNCVDCGIKGNCFYNTYIGECSWVLRKDGKQVIFKKLEKVGKPMWINDKRVQLIKALEPNASCYNCCFYHERRCLIPKVKHESNTFYVEIKQNKEDMEEKKLNLKEFDFEAAKNGKPVCTRNGRKARIICFDMKNDKPIVALLSNPDGSEYTSTHRNDGRIYEGDIECDLMMLPEKKEGWVNIAKDPLSNDRVVLGRIFDSYEDAVKIRKSNERYIDTTKVNWEE